MSSARRRHATPLRLIVISDLHLGGEPPHMMSQPDRLAKFITNLAEELPLLADERLELVIAGDFIDFLALPDFRAWTPDPDHAVDKLRSAMKSPFSPIFDALGNHIAAGHHLVVMVGNHDVELTIPQVQEELLDRLGASNHEVSFIDDGSAYRIGRLLIEHGNRYDGANANDWTGLRAHRSALSRNEPDPVGLRLHVSAGSELVEGLVSPLKGDYPFLDLLQPQGELLALLMVALEPGRINFDQIIRTLRANRRQTENEFGEQPGKTYQVGAYTSGHVDSELKHLFGSYYEQMLRVPQEVGAREKIFILAQLRHEGLARIIHAGQRIPQKRMRQIQAVMRRILADDKTFDQDDPAGTYSMAAARLNKCGFDTVIMGHTHLARHIGDSSRASYINTGTWADLIRPPIELQNQDIDVAVVEQFLRNLLAENLRRQHFTYADARIGPGGQVEHSRLRTYWSTMGANS